MKNITSMVDLYKITSVNLLINLKQLLTPPIHMPFFRNYALGGVYLEYS